MSQFRNPYLALVQQAEEQEPHRQPARRGLIIHVEGNNGQAPAITVATDTEYAQVALNYWRWENAWADHIPWENLPPKFQDTVRLAADILARTGYARRRS